MDGDWLWWRFGPDAARTRAAAHSGDGVRVARQAPTVETALPRLGHRGGRGPAGGDTTTTARGKGAGHDSRLGRHGRGGESRLAADTGWTALLVAIGGRLLRPLTLARGARVLYGGAGHNARSLEEGNPSPECCTGWRGCGS